MKNVEKWLKSIPMPVVEGVKESLRLAVIAAIPLIIAGINAGYIDWRLVVGAAVIAVLKGFDKYLHKTGVVEESPSLQKGLVRF